MRQERYRQARKVTLIGALVNVVLAISKITFGWMGQSQALVADGFHSLSDLLTDGLVLVASRMSSQAADADHPYGHERIETIATMLLSMLLLLVALLIIYDAVVHLMHGDLVTPHRYVWWVALFSIVSNEALFQYTRVVAKRIKSELIRANAWHHRSDAASSLIVLIGITAALLGFPYLDDIAAIVVGAFIIKMSWDLGWPSVRELVDTAVDPKQQQAIEQAIQTVTGVRALHQLRTRSMAGNILVDVHVLIDGKLSVSEGHHIAHRVQSALKQQFTQITDVTVHIDSEDDEYAAPSIRLPSRDILLPQIRACVADLPGADRIQEIVLHYLAGQLHIELRLPIAIATDPNTANALAKRYREALATLPNVAKIDVNFISEPE